MIKKLLKNSLINYILFAVLTSAINIVIFLIFYNYIFHLIIISNIFAYGTSITLQFITNKKYVFKNHSKNTKIQVIKFLLVKLISFFIDSFVLIVCHKFLYLDDFWSKLISNASTTISNYVFNKNIVFKDK